MDQARAAQAPTIAFHVPAEPLADALVDFGLQAGVSVGIGDLGACGLDGRAVAGRMTAAEGLARLLADSRCSFEAVDARTFRIVRKQPAPRLAPAPRPIAPPVVAAEAPAAANVVLDVTVTATKRPLLIDRIPASISTTPGSLLAEAHIDNLNDLTADFAGVTSTNLGPGRDKIFVRGLSDGAFTGRTQSTVGLYLDDVPITYNAPDPDLRLVDVDRVELMRGPQGTLYGVGSMGGIIRIITKKPDLDHADWGVAADYDFTRYGQPSNSVDMMINVPIVEGKAAVRAVAYRAEEGGYIDDSGGGPANVNHTRQFGGRIALASELSSDWRLTTGFNYQQLKSADSQYANASLPNLTRRNQVAEPHGNDFAQAYATLEGGGGWGRLKLSTSYLVHDFDSRYDASSVLPLFGAPPGPGAFDDHNRMNLAVAEAVVTSPAGRRLQWLVGAYGSNAIQRTSMAMNAFNLPPMIDPPPPGSPDPRQLYRERRRDHLGELALYGEATYPLGETLSLTGGLRFFHSWLSTTSLVRQGMATRPFDGSTVTNDVSPKAVLSWQATPARLFYLQASEGYRVGGFNTSGRIGQLFTAALAGRQPDRLFQPDSLWNFELGAKLGFLHDRLQLHGALYYDRWRNIQSDQFLTSGLPYTANVGNGDNKGLELEAEQRVGSRLTLRLNYLANEPELTDRDPTFPARRNASLPAVPQHSAALIADWRRPLNGGMTVVLHGRIAYVGSSSLTLEEANNQPMGDYVAGRIAAGVETKRWRVTGFVDNVGDSRGDTFAFGDPFSLGQIRQVTPLRPRTVGLTLAMGL